MSNKVFKKSSFLLKGLAATSVIGLSGIYLTHKDMRENPSLLVKGFVRQIKIIFCGMRMANIYMNPWFNNLTYSEKHEKSAKILRRTFEKNAGSYIKLGQVIATLEILIPDEYCTEMAKLFNRAPTTKFDDVMKLLKQELGNVDDIFEYIDPNPMSSASLAQVHRAYLKGSRTLVALKVQHPWIKENVPLDIKTVSFLINLGDKLFKDFNYKWVAEDMEEGLPQEIDFRNEIKNCERVEPLLKNEIKIPKIYKQFSTSKVLTLEFIKGYPITDVEKLNRDGIDEGEIAQVISKVFNRMIFKYGFVHADPHPGNIFVRPKKGQENKKHKDYDIVLLDHGIYRDLSPEVLKNYSKLWTGIITRDTETIKQAAQDLGVKNKYQLFTSMVTNQDYETVMDASQKDLKARIKGNDNFEHKKIKSQKQAKKYEKQILECLQEMSRELSLVFKITSYLNHIDRKLGEPLFIL